jgi:hypothetical protein
MAGLSYWNGKWQATRLAIAGGAALFRGSPSIAAWDPGASSSSYTVFVSTLATSSITWNRLPKLADQCVSLATYDSSLPDQICLLTLSVPKSGSGALSVTRTTCTVPGPAGSALVGTAVTVQSGTAYFASWNNVDKLVFYRGDSVSLAQPLAGHSMKGSPIFTKNTSLDLFAPDSNGTFWETSYTPATNSWSAPQAAPTRFRPFVWNSGTIDGMRTTTEYAAALLPGTNGPGRIFLVYRDGNAQMVAFSHSTSTPPGWAMEYETGGEVEESFHPALTVWDVPNELGGVFTGHHLAMTFWINNLASNTALDMRLVKNLGSTATTSALGTESPGVCLHKAYWGQRDEMAVWNNNTTSPRIYRFFTDSTKSACGPDTADWSANIPQHVAEFPFNP